VDSSGFRRARAGVIMAGFDQIEALLLHHLFGQFVLLLDEGELSSTAADPLTAALGLAASTAPSDDPALARLFPDAYREDPSASAEFRRYTEADLRQGKRANASSALASLDWSRLKQSRGVITLDDTQAQAWLRALNDLRLVLGARLETWENIKELTSSLSVDNPRLVIVDIYLWLGWLQETLVEAVGSSV